MSTHQLSVIDASDYHNLSDSITWNAGESGVEAIREDSSEFGVAEQINGQLSDWSDSRSKRLFDFLAVFCVLPVLIPAMLLIAVAVRLTSAGPALFLQKRMGRDGHVFTILKFRTMIHENCSRQVVTTSSDQRFTPIGPFLRSWKLDELPQLLNVLMGQMSLVGPRPKVPEHEPEGLRCRPGVTGAATMVFAREEQALDRIPREQLNAFYNSVVLPTKRQLDSEYMARATFSSDLMLIVNSVFGRWDSNLMESLLRFGGHDERSLRRRSKAISEWVIPRLVPSNMLLRNEISPSAD